MTDFLHTYADNSDIVIERIKHLPVGGRMKDIPEHLWHKSYVRTGEKKTGGPNLRLLRLDPAQPSNTVTAYIFNKFAHPTEDRYITPREAARLQQFPDSHQFYGPITSVQLQIGNAVPVGLARAVAEHVRSVLKKRHGEEGLPCAVSLFAGAGGMDLGFSEHFDVVSSNELVPDFAQTLRLNFPDTNIVEGSIEGVSAHDLNPEGKDISLVFGGPPCQPFSAAGRHGGLNDPRGQMVSEYLRIVDESKPHYFVLENVPGLVSNAKGGALQFIKDSAAAIGYETEHYILAAENYGVPQKRRRLFIFGRRAENKEQPLGPPVATHAEKANTESLLLQPCATVGQALEGLGRPQLRSDFMAEKRAAAKKA